MHYYNRQRTMSRQTRFIKPEPFQRCIFGDIGKGSTPPSISASIRAGHLDIHLGFQRRLEKFRFRYCLCELLEIRITYSLIRNVIPLELHKHRQQMPTGKADCKVLQNGKKLGRYFGRTTPFLMQIGSAERPGLAVCRFGALASFTVDWLDCSRTESHRIIRGVLAVVSISGTFCGCSKYSATFYAWLYS